MAEIDYDLPRVIEHLSASQIADYLRCPASWYLSRIAKLPQTPVPAIQVGLAIHRAFTAYHRSVFDEKQDADVELVTAWKEEVTAPGVPVGAMQRALKALALYRSLVRPLRIDMADWWFRVPIEGIPVPLIGAFDLVRGPDPQKPEDGAVWDWKTGKGTNWGQEKADTDLQATAYWLAYTHETEGQYVPAKFVYVVIQTDRGEPWIKPFTTYRSPEQVEAFKDLCREVYRRMLNDPIISTCPRNWCRYPEQCGRER